MKWTCQKLNDVKSYIDIVNASFEAITYTIGSAFIQFDPVFIFTIWKFATFKSSIYPKSGILLDVQDSQEYVNRFVYFWSPSKSYPKSES
jgi:hypothetical protein